MRSFFRKYGDKTECILCPHFCKIAEGKSGICGVRKNSAGSIELITSGIISGYALDPIEKKPLHHFFPGYNILSIGSFGCNMRCDFCQNYHISQNLPAHNEARTPSEAIIRDSISATRNIGVAFTYNEPIVSFEFVMETAKLGKKAGLWTVMVTNGYINSEPLDELLECIDAFNIDLKAFNNDYYKRLTGATLEPVKNSLKQISKAGKHLEITTLLVTGQNDSPEEMEEQVRWIKSELGDEVPLHLSRYFPMYKRADPTTPHETLKNLYEIATRHLRYVYLGNTMSETGQDTICPVCGTTVTKRSGYHIQHLNSRDGKCSACGKVIYKNFTFPSFQKGN